MTKENGTITQWFAGVPPIWVSTVGAKSGRRRNTPLFGILIDENLALIGAGFGQAPTPSWVYNLEAHPRVEVSFRGQTAAVLACPANSVEEDRVWNAGARIYPGFPRYRDRLTERTVRVFILERG
jgi:deazaflavin-dependent oxidoreductase (nitroreductase family)